MGFTWSLYYGTVLTISGNGAMEDYSYSNDTPWGDDITKVIIKDGVTSIGEYAFYGCTSLTSVDSNGYMVTGKKLIGGTYYTFNSSGVWVG